VNCEDKIKRFRIKNINSGHSAFDAEGPHYIRELDKQKNRVNGMLLQKIGKDRTGMVCLNV